MMVMMVMMMSPIPPSNVGAAVASLVFASTAASAPPNSDMH